MKITFHEYQAIWRDVQHAGNLREALGYVFAPPGWSPDGSTLTSRQLRAASASRPQPSGEALAAA